MQFPEVTLGIVPGIGAMVVPYRRWPQAAAVFHGMLTRGERLKAVQAQELGIVDELADGFDDLMARPWRGSTRWPRRGPHDRRRRWRCRRSQRRGARPPTAAC